MFKLLFVVVVVWLLYIIVNEFLTFCDLKRQTAELDKEIKRFHDLRLKEKCNKQRINNDLKEKSINEDYV